MGPSQKPQQPSFNCFVPRTASSTTRGIWSDRTLCFSQDKVGARQRWVRACLSDLSHPASLVPWPTRGPSSARGKGPKSAQANQSIWEGPITKVDFVPHSPDEIGALQKRTGYKGFAATHSQGQHSLCFRHKNCHSSAENAGGVRLCCCRHEREAVNKLELSSRASVLERGCSFVPDYISASAVTASCLSAARLRWCTMHTSLWNVCVMAYMFWSGA